MAADALDRIDSIGRQAHADMQTAVTAAETATTSAENAKESATNAEKSADTATQAASRAETAKASAETSATQAETAMQGAETARAEAVKSQNNAKISAAQASTAAQQTEADKTITAGYAKTAKTNADSTAADRQAVQTLAEQVTADKTTVADHAAQVTTDRKAAETAAQTAQSIADSLPEDYTTAVGKIAENTAEIANVKLMDKELTRRVNALYSIGNGITHQFETDSETAYTKTIPTGAKLMSVKSVSGRSIVFNQIFQPRKEANNGATVTADSDGTITINGTTTASYINFRDVTPEQNKVGKYAFKLLILNNPDNIEIGFGFLNRSKSTPRITSGSSAVIYNQTQYEISLGKSTGISGFAVGTVFNDVKIKIQIFDLTLMFGSGNEPSTVEEFKAIFPSDYYQYNTGEIITADTESVAAQGKNLFDIKKCVKLNSYYGFEIDTNKTLQIDLKDGKTCPTNVSFGIVYVHGNTMANWLITSNGVRETITNSRDMTDSTQIMVACYPGSKETMQSIADAFDIMLVDGIYKSDTMPAYAPYHSNVYQIPEAIRNLPGYGWSAGTAKNYVNYENKRYVQCVGKYTFTGSENWVASGDNQYYAVLKTPATKVFDMNTKSNCLMATIPTESVNSVYGGTKTGLGINFLNNVSYAYISADDYNNRVSKINGQDMYYELATPIVTDISSLIPDDFLRNIEVEAGGSVTFKGGNDDYRIPVPNEEEYVVKLSEVGGTT